MAVSAEPEPILTAPDPERAVRGLCQVQDGALLAEPYRDQDSSLVTVFALADALLRRPVGAPAVQAGGLVDVLPLARA